MKEDFDFKFKGAGMYGDNFYNQFWLDENAEYHRDDGPAIKYGGGGEAWMRHGKVHRDDDLPAVTDAEGNQAWYQDNQFHREGKPAVVYRDGRPDEWWEKGRRLTPQEVEDILFAQNKADVVAKRGNEVANALRQHAQGQLKAPKPARFSK